MGKTMDKSTMSSRIINFLSRIESWDKANEEWSNFLRYMVELDEQRLLKARTGMQAWNKEDMAWENRNFTRKYTHFWSEQIVNSVNDIPEFNACVLPNPYPVGAYFFCDLPDGNVNLQLELYDVLGRPVYQQDVRNGDAFSIDSRPAPGVYILRIRDQNQLHHLQRLIIH